MNDVVIYHNPRCSKSRAALQYLEEKGVEYEVQEYLKDPLSATEIAELLILLGEDVKEVLRTGEEVFKAEYKGKELIGKLLVDALTMHPILLERPIVRKGKRAVIARPTEKIDVLL